MSDSSYKETSELADGVFTEEVVGMYQEANDASPIGAQFYATLFHGATIVRIPLEKFTELDMVALNMRQKEANRGILTVAETADRYLHNRIGAEVDFVITGEANSNNKAHVVYGDRLEAMKRLRKKWFEKNENGNYVLGEGIAAEARVIAVARLGIRVELSGIEAFIDNHDLFWDGFTDTRAKFNVGDKVNVLIKNVIRDEEAGEISEVQLSVKELTPNPRDTALEAYQLNGKYKGTIKHIKTATPPNKDMYYVELPGGIICGCIAPDKAKTKPRNGDSVLIVITRYQKSKRNLYGRIIHFSRKEDDNED